MNKRVSRGFGILFLLLELAVVPKALQLMLNRPLAELSPAGIVTLAMTFGSIALCILMSFSSMSEHDNYPKQTFLFELMVFLCCIAPMTDLMTKALDTAGRPVMNMLVNTVFYLVGINLSYVIMRYEYLIIGADRKPVLRRIENGALILTLLGNAVTLVNIRFGFFFTITESGAYRSAPTFWTAYIIPLIIIVITAVTATREMPRGRLRDTFLLFWVFALSASLIQMWREDLTVQYTGYTLSLIVIYINIQSELDTYCVGKPINAQGEQAT